MSDAGADHREPVIVATFLDAGEAEVAQAKLRAFGIEAMVIDRAEGGVINTVEVAAGVGVEVRAADAADALAILNDEGGEAEPAEPA